MEDALKTGHKDSNCDASEYCKGEYSGCVRDCLSFKEKTAIFIIVN